MKFISAIIYLIVLSTLTWASTGGVANKTEISWTVPDNVDTIRVSSTIEGKIVLNTTINVKSGQIFKVETVK